MDGILIAIISVTVIGIICAVMLSVASKIMAVKEDERFPIVRACLPGANCGACGYAGCDGYAHALIEEEGVKTNLCIPGADAVSKKLSEALGVEFEDVIEQIAVIKCRGDCNVTSDKMDYQGIESCAAAKLLFGGTGKCTFG
ncbi:MAG: RnfABCDGE type electron transport complex subunit B, partial [Clostridia bacterium]|nr:RnfABCDGE type electron transport complex subunit B [Clostridia bacterium]